jgi:hypothetical protein
MENLNDEFENIAKQRESKQVRFLSLMCQADRFFERAEQSARQIVADINGDPGKLKIAGSKFEFEKIENGFRVMKLETIPAFYLKVRNHGRFIRADLEAVKRAGLENAQTSEKSEEFSFELDENGYIYVIEQKGQTFSQPSEMNLYLLRPLWS